MKFARLFLVAFTVAAAMPACGQSGTSLSSADSAAPNAAAVPDLSGLWTKPYLGVESPLSGPGPVTNMFRRPQPGASGVLVSTFTRLVGDYTNPILKPEAAEIVRKRGEIELRGTPNASARNQCWPEGVPAILYNIAMEMLQQPDRVTLLYANDHQVRFVRMNQPHPAQVKPSWYGDSVGHYEGDTLVVDTVGVRVGPLSMIDFFGTPFTDALHVVERYRLIDYRAAIDGQERGLKEWNRLAGGGGDSGVLIDSKFMGKGLELHFIVEDEGAFTRPWSANVTYRRAANIFPENVCAENLRGTFGTRDSAAPQANKPDF